MEKRLRIKISHMKFSTKLKIHFIDLLVKIPLLHEMERGSGVRI
jgi:hypothetical protein